VREQKSREDRGALASSPPHRHEALSCADRQDGIKDGRLPAKDKVCCRWLGRSVIPMILIRRGTSPGRARVSLKRPRACTVRVSCEDRKLTSAVAPDFCICGGKEPHGGLYLQRSCATPWYHPPPDSLIIWFAELWVAYPSTELPSDRLSVGGLLTAQLGHPLASKLLLACS
jgi:hypothetical protein